MVETRQSKQTDNGAGIMQSRWVTGTVTIPAAGAAEYQVVDQNGADLVIEEGVRIGRMSTRTTNTVGSAGLGLSLTSGGAIVETLFIVTALVPRGIFVSASPIPIATANNYVVLSSGLVAAGDVITVDIELLA